jgi:hypothetical protein
MSAEKSERPIVLRQSRESRLMIQDERRGKGLMHREKAESVIGRHASQKLRARKLCL